MSFPHTIADGRYTLVEPLGVGGMATVFKAFDQRLQVWRAVKILNAQYSNRPSLRDRFETEARTTALLEHKHIVKVYDVGRTNGQPFIVMELVQGGNLVDWVKRHGPMPPRLSAEVTCQVCEGVAAAHNHKVIHRDIKPHNVLITSTGTCLITDFGIARVGDESDGLTRTGAVFGTWAYMAPEQRNDAKKVDRRADVYSLAATLYFLLTGRTPVDLFAAEKDPTVLEGIEEALVPVLVKATQYSRTDRYSSVEELAAALRLVIPDIVADPPDTPPLAGILPPPDQMRSGARAVVEPGGNITLMPDAGPVSSGVTMVPSPGVDDSLVFETPEGKVVNLRNIADLVAAGILVGPDNAIPSTDPRDLNNTGGQGFLPLVTSMPPDDGPAPTPRLAVPPTPPADPYAEPPPSTDVPYPDELAGLPDELPEEDEEGDEDEDDPMGPRVRFMLGAMAGVLLVLLAVLGARRLHSGEVEPPDEVPPVLVDTPPGPGPTPVLDPTPVKDPVPVVDPTPAVDPQPPTEDPLLQPKNPQGPDGGTPAPKPPMGTVKVSGEAGAVSLERDGKRHAPGKVPPGTYKVFANFGGGEVPAGEVTVADKKTVTLSCVARFKKCTAQ